MRGKTKNFLTLLLGLVLALAVLLVAEFGGWAWLRMNGHDTEPFLIHWAGEEGSLPSYQQDWGDTLVVSYIDPHLGFAHDAVENPFLSKLSGFVKYGEGETADAELLIIALGGSTTDAMTPIFLDDPKADPNAPYNWPRELQLLLERAGYQAIVLNGGVAGYSSSQQVLKLMRDSLPLEPDVVIFLDGVNEIGFVQSVPDRPMVHKYQKKVFDSLTSDKHFPALPNFVSFLRRIGKEKSERSVAGVNYGLSVKTTPAENWLRNMRSAKVLSNEFGSEFMEVLQPILGYGEYRATPELKDQLKKRGEKYLVELKAFYSDAAALCAETPYCLDLTPIYAHEEEIYFDPRHQNEKGVKILAGHIFRELESRGMLENDSRATRTNPSALKVNLSPPREHTQTARFDAVEGQENFDPRPLNDPGVAIAPEEGVDGFNGNAARELPLRNGSFEEWSDGVPVGWELVSGAIRRSESALDGRFFWSFFGSRVKVTFSSDESTAGKKLRVRLSGHSERGRLSMSVMALVDGSLKHISRNPERDTPWLDSRVDRAWGDIIHEMELTPKVNLTQVEVILLLRREATEAALVDDLSLSIVR